MKILPRREFEEEFVKSEEGEGGLSKEEALRQSRLVGGFIMKGSGAIVLPEGVSSSVRLHELGHKAYGHPSVIDRTIEDNIIAEIEAESYSWEMRGKPLNYRVGLPAVRRLQTDEKFSPEKAAYWVSLILVEDFGILVPNGGKRELIRWAKGRYY